MEIEAEISEVITKTKIEDSNALKDYEKEIHLQQALEIISEIEKWNLSAVCRFPFLEGKVKELRKALGE
jgi:hypothetical protein